MADVNPHAYNTAWQFRADAWCRLEEASRRLSITAARGNDLTELTDLVEGLLSQLRPFERYWAFPGIHVFGQTHRLFATGAYEMFGRAVSKINRALVTESYRSGLPASPLESEGETLGADEGSLEVLGLHRSGRPYFELLIVATMTEAQERALRNEIHARRRPDDAFVYEIVVVGSGDEAVIAARLNASVQACAITRRFAHRSRRDLSALSHFVDAHIAEDLAEHSPEERAAILANAIKDSRPEIDMYLITELEVEDVAARLGHHFRRVFHGGEAGLDQHLSLLEGIAARYRTPFFSALREYSHRPTGVFHALPISQGKSIVGSHWISDMIDFYGLEVFLAETSATCGGLDSLLEPTGPLREAQALAARTFGSRHTYFVTNGTSTANKIVEQALVAPGDIVLVDRNCHQSHHYGLMMAGAQVTYLDAYPLNQYSMYGAVPLREIKSRLLALRAAGKLDRVKLLTLTNCTFDGIVYDVERVMEECLAIKPDLVFLWDEAWFAFARFHHVYRKRTAMHAARAIRERLRSPEYRKAYLDYAEKMAGADDETLLNTRLLPDPASARVRVYATQSTHKTLTSLRQGSMIHVYDQDFDQKVEEPFHEAYMAHTSTSPNYQVLASLDIGRRQADLEGVELVQKQVENAMQLRDAIDKHPLLSRYMHCLSTGEMIPSQFRPSGLDQPLRTGLRNMATAWEQDEFVLDPSRITLYIGNTGIDGDTFKRAELMDRYGVQINKTSRNTVLFMTNIGTTRSSVAYLVEVLVNVARELDDKIADMSLTDRSHHERAVLRLTSPSAPLPDFSGFHSCFTEHDGDGAATPDGDVRRAFYLGYDDTFCEYLSGDEVEERMESGQQVVSATFVTPYPPGFPILVPGQIFSRQILSFIRALDTKEIHGYKPHLGFRVFTAKAMEMAEASVRPWSRLGKASAAAAEIA
ncbi:aminotransferase class I/II-fold pyridoxal phosphate-dependent enzyme [Mycobacterium branderi]|uniref:Decarboxylase n=1 Tax=Mycobacterium branderi TaxID=43348 RepID=A0A7I7W188_9MYCO|nr:ornithine decarboxylase [Mycobacterium branderi]MCV7235327.1 ornithine decarboxylase [Mycobacterium branderi]ORA32950.1 ornithine decarboxylase [Mycobacterium branderi]BBZ10900.1 decarboxylase [Mycobacterium branderi]